jgi:hypothetical protein
VTLSSLTLCAIVCGVGVINTLLNCIINKTLKFVLWNRSFASGKWVTSTVRRKFVLRYWKLLRTKDKLCLGILPNMEQMFRCHITHVPRIGKYLEKEKEFSGVI